MTTYLGNYAAGATVYFMWNSNGADGASITRATNGTISVYKSNNTTQSVAGVTDTEDFDALTGVHHVAINTAADGTFYAAGNDFMVVVSGATIDGKTVNAVLAHFSIQNRYPAVADVQSGLATAASLTTVAGYIDTEVAAILAAVDTEVAAIKAKTDNLPASPAAVGSAMTLADGAVTAAKVATGAIDADALAADAIDLILDEVVEGTLTMRQMLRIMLAALAGKSAGGGTTTITFRDVADTKNRISATIDANRNRTSVTRDGS